MPQGLDAADRKLLIGAGMLFVGVVIASALLLPQATGRAEVPSSYSPQWGGAEATYLLLRDTGYRVTRWERSPLELPADASHAVLILADPSVPPAEDEKYAVSDFVRRGGRVIATGPEAADFLPGATKFQEGAPFARPEVFRALVPSPLTRDAPKITMTAPSSWQPKALQKIVVYGNEGTAAVVAYRVGKGEVVWWASATPLLNQSLNHPDNLAFFLNCVGPRAGTHVYWDEYFHGMRGSLAGFFSETPIFWALAQIGLIFVAVVFTFSRRLGPVREPSTPSRLSPLEFVDTLGDLYASAKAYPTAIGIAYRRFRFILTRKLALPLDTPTEVLAKAASETFGWEEGRLLDVLRRCEMAVKDVRLQEEDSVEMVQQLHDYAAQLEIRRADRQIRAKGRQSA